MRSLLLLQQLYARLSELLGLHDHLLLLNVIVSKIATNLKCYTEVKGLFLFYLVIFLLDSVLYFYLCLFQSEEVIDHTLSLFLDLASG